MARVTVEDCILKVPNRFDLVMMAAERARRIAGREPLTIERDNDKDPVVALREIAEETISTKQMEENLVSRYQRHGVSDEPEDEDIEFDATSEELAALVANEAAPPAKEREVLDEVEEGDESE